MEPSAAAETTADTGARLQRAWRQGYDEGVRSTLQRLSKHGVPGEHGTDISTVKLLRYAIQDLPGNLEILDMHGTSLRGEVTDNYALGKSLFMYGRYYRPINLGEPF